MWALPHRAWLRGYLPTYGRADGLRPNASTTTLGLTASDARKHDHEHRMQHILVRSLAARYLLVAQRAVRPNRMPLGTRMHDGRRYHGML